MYDRYTLDEIDKKLGGLATEYIVKANLKLLIVSNENRYKEAKVLFDKALKTIKTPFIIKEHKSFMKRYEENRKDKYRE